MSFGVPVVATDSGSISELLDSSCGRLVPHGRPERITDALFDIYRDPGAARLRAERGYRIVSERHDVRIQMDHLLHLMLKHQRIEAESIGSTIAWSRTAAKL